jgi:hypothetical protein
MLPDCVIFSYLPAELTHFPLNITRKLETVDVLLGAESKRRCGGGEEEVRQSGA